MPRSASFASLIQKLVRDQVPQQAIQGCLMQPVARRRRPQMGVGDVASGGNRAGLLAPRLGCGVGRAVGSQGPSLVQERRLR
jgi:hypothetical protein